MMHVPDEVHNCLTELGLALTEDNIVVLRKDAPAHPRNWSFARKMYDTGVLVAFITISYVASLWVSAHDGMADLAGIQRAARQCRSTSISILWATTTHSQLTTLSASTVGRRF